jgi:hypothetical protein
MLIDVFLLLTVINPLGSAFEDVFEQLLQAAANMITKQQPGTVTLWITHLSSIVTWAIDALAVWDFFSQLLSILNWDRFQHYRIIKRTSK